MLYDCDSFFLSFLLDCDGGGGGGTRALASHIKLVGFDGESQKYNNNWRIYL